MAGNSWKSGGLTANFLNNINEYLPKLEYLNIEGIRHKKIEIEEPYDAHEVYQVIFTHHPITHYIGSIAMTANTHQEATAFIETHTSFPSQHLHIQTKQEPAGKRRKLVDADEPKITNKLLRDIAMKYDHEIVIINLNGETIKKAMFNEEENMEDDFTMSDS